MAASSSIGCSTFRRTQIFLKLGVVDEKLLATCAGTINVDGRVYPLLRDTPVKVDLEVTGPLELFVDHIVHLGARVDQGRR